MSSITEMVANTLPIPKSRDLKKSRTSRKGRDMYVPTNDNVPVSDSASTQTVKVTMAFEDNKTASEEHLLEVPENIDVFV